MLTGGKRQPETNTGVLYGSDPSGLGSTTLKMVLGGGDHSNKERRKAGLLDPKLLGYTKSMMWYPQARLQPAAQGSQVRWRVASATGWTPRFSGVYNICNGQEEVLGRYDMGEWKPTRPWVSRQQLTVAGP